eukprot:CAMPEP_0168376960 /NCGR_PEP_ID=MMETSP0228-20121227/10583_1 /TAXON_ID=133427 /ORGANISM="Protoceratium reticulatum, Strain CCCM 535 (=CCMP 1889)" /LENGTH=529 /DNA_ID=CAMNT_0008389949 /DNA_START=88 /DNA_END=1674 /DNA_ORIENTATION=-
MEGAKVAKLVQRCVADVARNPVENVDVYVGDDITTWHVALHFPEAAPFVGGSGCTLEASGFSLHVLLTFTEAFPAKPPRFKFLSPWINHQHLWGDRICHSLLSDDFLDYFRERRTHGTSMWNAASALADGDGTGGMPRYLQVLREFLASDLDYDEEKHVKYDAESLQHDVEVQRSFRPPDLREDCRLQPDGEVAPCDGVVPDGEPQWGTDFFSKEPLVPGNLEGHPCFDVSLAIGRVPTLSTSMTSLSPKSFELGARTTDFGSTVAAVLPYPCSRKAWTAAGAALAAQALKELVPVTESFYALQLPSLESDAAAGFEAMLGIVGELWKTTCIAIVKDEGHASERAMMCFVTVHFLLLCLAEEHPGLREHAVATAREFVELIDARPLTNLKSAVPDLGRFLVRFLLTQEEAPLRAGAPAVVRELFRRNVRWVHPDLWPAPDAPGPEQEQQTEASFAASQFGMKLTVFQSYYILRSTELGMDTLDALEACGGQPPAGVLRAFQGDCREIKEMGGYAEFLLWLQLEDLAGGD